ncbi:MAG: hypothetical protein IT285_05200 [Bdellovibrionales bacterium]|nr:hypothetical protein [Bdellovibrionales bacterium]
MARVNALHGQAWRARVESMGERAQWLEYPPAGPWKPLKNLAALAPGDAIVVSGGARLELGLAGGWKVTLLEGEFLLMDARGSDGDPASEGASAWSFWRVRKGRLDVHGKGVRSAPAWIEIAGMAGGKLRLSEPHGALAGARGFPDGSAQIWLRTGSGSWLGPGENSEPVEIPPGWSTVIQGAYGEVGL